MHITKPRQLIKSTYFQLFFAWRDDPHAGFAFDCDEQGHIDEKTLSAGSNYQKCLNGTHDVAAPKVLTCHHSYVEPAEGLCACGLTVVLEGDTRGEGIDCECGRIYNSAGQELAPRSQWEESY